MNRRVFVGVAVALLVACGSRSGLEGLELSVDSPDAAVDVPMDASIVARGDAGLDSAAARDVSTVDGTVDSGLDTGFDAGLDTGARDAGVDTGPLCKWGGFAPAVSYTYAPPGSASAMWIAAADFDHDGHVDVAVTDGVNRLARVFLNNGDGTLRASVSYPIGSQPNQMVGADFDGDGFVDLAIANGELCGPYCCSPDCYARVAVLRNRGDGTFAAPSFWSTQGSWATSLLVGDVNGDRAPDLVTMNYNSADFAVLLNRGDGTFAKSVNYLLSGSDYPRSIAMGDVDGDGALDMLVGVASPYGARFAVLLNDGHGVFHETSTYQQGDAGTFGYLFATTMLLADFSATGRNDLVASDTNADDVYLFPHADGGVFGSPTTYDAGSARGELVAADFDGDGNLDVAMPTWDRATPTQQAITILFNRGHGVLAPPQRWPALEPGAGTAAADLNGDGHPDIVFGQHEGLAVMLSQCR
jgi:hypothetical protein